MYLLDTNMLIYFFKGMGAVAANLFSKSPKDIAVSVISMYEIEVGIAKSPYASKRREQLATFSSRISVLPFTEIESAASANVRAELERRGTPIGPLDHLIAGTALGRNAILVTHNTREFERVEGLVVEDWF